MSDRIREQVYDFLRNFCGGDCGDLEDRTKIFQVVNEKIDDLAPEHLLVSFIKKFNICVPKQDFETYYRSKHRSRIFYPFHWVYFLYLRDQIPIDDVDVADLIVIAEKGRWDF